MRYKSLFATTALITLVSSALPALAFDQITSETATLGGTYTYLTSINLDGTVLGGNSMLAGDADTSPVIYDNGTLIDIGTFGGTYGFTNNVSSDGSVAIGYSATAGDAAEHAFMYTSGILTDLGTLGGTNSNAYWISSDNSVIVGTSDNNLGDHNAFRWESGVMTDLGNLGGDWSFVQAITPDASVMVGDSEYNSMLGRYHAFRWESGVMTDLGTLGGNNSSAYDVSNDGTIIVGQAQIASGINHAFRWENNVMTDIGTLNGFDNNTISEATYVTADGSVVIGVSALISGSFDQHAFRWESGVMTDLGTLGGNNSTPFAFTSDASVIYGTSTTAGEASVRYFRWNETSGTSEDLQTYLSGIGIDMTNWDLTTSGYAKIVLSADENVLAGLGEYMGNSTIFLVSQSTGGITTPEDLTETLIPVAQTRQQTVSGLNVGTQQSLFASRQAFSGFRGDFFMPDPSPENLASLAPAAGGHTFDSPALASRYSAYVTGAFGVGASNNSANTAGYGTTGLFARLSDEWAVGLGVITGSSFTQLKYGGEGRLTGFGGALNIAHESADSGWRIYGTATVQSLNLDMERNYLNGSGIDGSTGETDGIGFAGAVQLGYALPVSQTVSLMPYASIDASRTRMDGYSETGGAFPATFSKQTATVINGHLGVEGSYQAASNLTLKGRTAWGHQLESRSNSATATALSITYTLPYEDGAPNWVETGITANWQVSDRLNMTTDLAGRFGDTGEPAASATIGLSYGF